MRARSSETAVGELGAGSRRVLVVQVRRSSGSSARLGGETATRREVELTAPRRDEPTATVDVERSLLLWGLHCLASTQL